MGRWEARGPPWAEAVPAAAAAAQRGPARRPPAGSSLRSSSHGLQGLARWGAMRPISVQALKPSDRCGGGAV